MCLISRELGKTGVWVWTMGFALSLLLAWSCCDVCTSQFYLTPSVTTRPSETTFYRTDEIDLTSMLVSLLDYVAIIKEEYWGRYGDNLTLTYPGDGSCSMLGIGFALDSVAASQVWGSPLTQEFQKIDFISQAKTLLSF